MTPQQREAALRLVDIALKHSADSDSDISEETALLRELASEQAQEPVASFRDWVTSLTPAELYDFDSEGRGYKKDQMRMMRLAWDAAAAPQQRKPLVDEIVRPLIDDTSEVFDANGPETPQVVRDVIEYVQSWLEVYFDKRGGTP